MDGVVHSQILLALVEAAVSRRPLLLSCQNAHSIDCLAAGTEQLARRVFPGSATTLRCHRTTRWSQIGTQLLAAGFSPSETPPRERCLILQNVDVLRPRIQIRLAAALHTLEASFRTFAGDTRAVSLEAVSVVLIGSSTGLQRDIRAVLLLENRIDDCPAARSYSTTAADTAAATSAGSATATDQTQPAPLDLEHWDGSGAWRCAQDARERLAGVVCIPSVRAYIQDVVVHMRTHRFVRSGVTARAVDDILLASRVAAVVADRDFIAPASAASVIRRVLAPKIELCTVTEEMSLQYGSDQIVVAAWIEQHDPRGLIDAVLSAVPALC